MLHWQEMDVYDALAILDLPRGEGYYDRAIRESSADGIAWS